MFKKAFASIFGTKNDKEIKKYKKRVKAINDLEQKYEKLSDDELKSTFGELKERAKNESLDSLLNDSFAITREASKRILGMRHFDVQMIGGMVLHEGKIAEMKTGEGKTLVATLPVVLNALSQKGVHVVTVNDYLAKRDGTQMGELYRFLGFSVGIITGDLSGEDIRKEQYRADITYGTNNEFGFDYLRDNMKINLDDVLQLNHNYAIVDEVDSILIDEARTPLIISGPVNKKMEHYQSANEVAKKMVKDEDFTIDEKNRVILITEIGITKAEKLFGVDNLYEMQNAILAHHIEQALKAHNLFTKDVDYVVKDGEVVIVDEFTGRLSTGRRYSEGLHQALEAKEGVLVKEESQTLADITFQNYFRMYGKLSGMTGTAQTEATEFSQIYNLDVLSIPTNIPVTRIDKNDLIYKTAEEKYTAVIEKIKELSKSGQPALVGTVSIEQSELLSKMLKNQKIPHTVLNAKQHEKEAEIIINAGKKGAITIATNMAGRGVDIKIDDEIKSLGGLYIIGTERHESRRIDNQLRGRSGRQGDPGATQFYLSLEDNLLRIFGSERISKIMDKLGVEKGEFIDSKMVTRAVENAQKKVESMHFDSRKHLLEYDDVSNAQRKVIFTHRREVLDKNFNIQEKISSNIREVLENILFECNIIAGMPKEDYDLKALTEEIRETFNIDIGNENLASLEKDEIKETLFKKLSFEYENKMSQLEDARRDDIERIVYLQILDESWREHLYQMDVMKMGIGLRGYNQKDPLVEYKKESFGLFEDLVKRIKKDSTKTLFMIRFTFEEPAKEKEALEKMKEKMEREAFENASMIHEGSPTSNSDAPHQLEQKKVARNSDCPCGSGKKYKQCCGKSGPKKGLLASKKI
ncbi:MAG: preprotein translocase subunit SecA [Campylobacterota bacterium]|nr:preprotein translocase subunit SecA [Campylobacterota bacterium]